MKRRRIDLRLETRRLTCELLRRPPTRWLPGLAEPVRQGQPVVLPAVRVRVFRFPDPALPGSPSVSGAARPPRPAPRPARTLTRLSPPPDLLSLRDRLFCRLQPPIETWLGTSSLELPAQPFTYQAQGIAFLVPRYSALLGDEMGLGKTMQAIVALRMLLAAGLVRHALIVCPKPLVSNWAREFRLWAPDLPTLIIEGSARRRHALWELANMPVKIVNYELLTRDAHFLHSINAEFHLVVLDEAQRIKNPQARISKTVRSLKRQRSWALTGTPLENRPEDLISIFSFLDPGLICGSPTLSRLRRLTQPYLLRRLKEHVLTELPSKFVRDTHLDLTPAQYATYRAAEHQGVLKLNNLGDALAIQNVFELILRLKQVCNFDPVTGQSAKLEQLRTDLEQIASSGRKALVFSQWVATLKRLRDELADYRPLEFHGQVRPAARAAVLRAFCDDPNRHVLLISYGAGSVGLNLQCAQYVFLFDRWWNPAVEDQAINRVYRIGQQLPVFITRFLTTGTIEERINEVLERKRALMDMVVPGSPPDGRLSLTEEEIFGLFDLGPPRGKRAAA